MNPSDLNILRKINDDLKESEASEISTLCKGLSLEAFADLQYNPLPDFPRLIQWLPKMPSQDVQESWCGFSGDPLKIRTVSILDELIKNYLQEGISPLETSNVLDFGCGWGRFLRLLSKFVPAKQLYGVDPWRKSIELCHSTGMKGNIHLSDYLPRDLPFIDQTFDFIFSFSVFTHLSKKVTEISLNTLQGHLGQNGVLMVTIRPISFWDFKIQQRQDISAEKIAHLKQQHLDHGMAFLPRDREPIEGEVTYGDTSISIDYLKEKLNELHLCHVINTGYFHLQNLAIFKRI